MTDIKKILDEEIERARLGEDEISYLNGLSNLIIDTLKSKIKKKRIDASVFLGGSLAKNTIIRKPKYDIDIFVRFSTKYPEEEIKRYMKKIFFWLRIPGTRIKVRKIHGSRDYYRITLKPRKNLSFEVVPSVDIKNATEARNITDLSYFHVDYIKKQFEKNKKLVNQIILAKSFCHAQKCYGAESYIKGFSGYALELLISYYKSFIKFLGAMVKVKDQIVVDPAKHYKTKEKALKSLTPGKLHSPVILIDPTFKERNAARALSYETFKEFQKVAAAFLEKPDAKFFQHRRVNLPFLRTTAQDINGIFVVFEISTKKQEGDVAGSKMLKFSKVLTKELSRYFDVIESEYDYLGEKKANMYYVLKRKDKIINVGPSIYDHNAVKKFKEKHRIWYIEESRIKSAYPTDLSVKEFYKIFKKKSKKTMREMGIKKVKII